MTKSLTTLLRIASWALLLFALAWTVWYLFAGFGNPMDPHYWLYKYSTLKGGWLSAGTILTGGMIVRLFGVELLPLRIAGWVCVAAAIALPYCILLTREQRRANIHWLALAYLLMQYGAFQEFSPGTLSVLLLSLLWVTSVKSQIINYKLQILTAILLGIAVSVRFPNILALLILIPLWKKRCLWNIPIAAAVAGLVYLLGYWLVTPAAADASMMTSHGLQTMLSKYMDKAPLLVGMLFVSVGVLAIGHLRDNMRIKHPAPLAGFLVGVALVFFLIGTTKPHQWYNTDLTYLISAICLVLAIVPSFVHSFTPSLLVGTAFMVVATLGTDTAWLKLFPAVLCLLPVAAVDYAPEKRVYLWTMLAVFSIFVASRMSTNSVGQSDLTKATAFASVSPYKGIAIQPAEQERLMQYKADFDSLSNEQMVNILALGQEMHLMRAVTGCGAARYNEFWSNIFDSVYTAKYRDIIIEEQPIVFCSFTPQFKTKKSYTDGASALELMLLDEGYRPLDRTQYKYMIYIPSEH